MMNELAADVWRAYASYARTAIVTMSITTVGFIAVAGFRLGVLSVSAFPPLVVLVLLTVYLYRELVSSREFSARSQAIYLACIAAGTIWSIMAFATTPGNLFFRILPSPEVSYVPVSTSMAMEREVGEHSAAVQTSVALFDRGTAELKVSNYTDAANLYKRSSAVLPTSAAQMNAAAALLKVGQLQAADHEIAVGLGIARKRHDTVVEAGLLAVQGDVYNKEGRLREGRNVLESAFRENQRIKNYRGQANSLGSLSLVLSKLGEFEEAWRSTNKALALHEVYGPSSALIDDHLALASLLATTDIGRGDMQEAAQETAKALSLAQKADDTLAEAKVRTEMALIDATMHGLTEAKENVNIALATFKKHDDLAGEARALGTLAWIDALSGHYDDALNVHSSQLALAEREGDVYDRAAILLNMGYIRIQPTVNQVSDAQRNFGTALELSRQMGAQQLIVAATSALAQTYLLAGDIDRARELAKESLRLAQELNETSLIAKVWSQIGDIESAGHNIPAAKEAYTEALQYYIQVGGYRAEVESIERRLRDLG